MTNSKVTFSHVKITNDDIAVISEDYVPWFYEIYTPLSSHYTFKTSISAASGVMSFVTKLIDRYDIKIFIHKCRYVFTFIYITIERKNMASRLLSKRFRNQMSSFR